MSFAFAACCARVSKHTPMVLQHAQHYRRAIIVFISPTGLRLEYFQEWNEDKNKKKFSAASRKAGWSEVRLWIYLTNPATWQPCIVCAGIGQMQHLGYTAHKIWTGYSIPHDINQKQALSFLESVTLHKQTTDMPCQPHQRVKKMCGLDYH